MQERKGREADLGKEQGLGGGSKREETGEGNLQRYMYLSFYCLGAGPKQVSLEVMMLTLTLVDSLSLKLPEIKQKALKASAP